jgi:hypothetical protein
LGGLIIMSQQTHHGMRAATLAGVTWRKSKHSGCVGNCVEVAALNNDKVAMRNSREPNGPALIFGRDEMAAFLAGAKDGKFESC